jgi:hypothetical protein
MGSKNEKATRWNVEHYRQDAFLRGISHGMLQFRHAPLDAQQAAVPSNMRGGSLA